MRVDEVHKVSFPTSFGDVEFGLKLPGWEALEKLNSDCTIIDRASGSVIFGQAKFKKLVRLASIVEHPFPEGKLDEFLPGIAPIVFDKLWAKVDEIKKSAVQEAKK